MSVTFMFGKQRADGVRGFTFPACDADLEDDAVDGLKMRPALRRFAKELVRQRPRHSTHPLEPRSRIIGVKIHAVSVTFVLGDKLPLTDKQKAAIQKQRDEWIARAARREA